MAFGFIIIHLQILIEFLSFYMIPTRSAISTPLEVFPVDIKLSL